MAYYHGVRSTQVPTSILPPKQISAAIPVFVGCAPIHRTSYYNTLKSPHFVEICYTNAEAVKKLGYTSDDDFEKWGLSEAAYTMFVLHQRAPAIFINIFDPAQHREVILNETISLTNSKGQASKSDLISLKLYDNDNAEYQVGTDYTYNNATGQILVSATGQLANKKAVQADFIYATPEAVTVNECIGGVDYETNQTTGLQLIDRIFSQYRVVPGSILAPGFSDNPSVAAIMATKAGSINGIFRAIAIADLPTSITDHTKTVAFKNDNNLVQEDLALCWPRVVFNEKVMRLSTMLAGVIATTDSDHDDIPYASPSNKNINMQSATVDGINELWLETNQANYLNENGIITALNFIGGWKTWGNRMSCYPDVTDIKDTFISNRRMFGWYGNRLIQTWCQKVDDPIGKRFVQTIVNSEQITLNSYTAKGYILGGRIAFLSDENSTTDLMDGLASFHIYWGTQSPAENINFNIEYDPQYLTNLFS
ncbi:phage tail sheath family protein [Orbus mooreae]|uniref:phage tail sheath family protein n=1 Tax=Orbus mooreae TaxID=3074107 RepID=UPI00370D3EC6